MSIPPVPAGLLRRRLCIALGLAALAGGLMALRIALHGEFWLDRTFHLVLIATIAAGLGASMTWPLLARLRPAFVLRQPRLAYALAFGLAFLGIMGLAYVLHAKAYIGDFELNPERPIRGLIMSTAQTFAVFLISSPTYLLPWLLPVLTLSAALVLPLGDSHLEAVEKPGKDV